MVISRYIGLYSFQGIHLVFLVYLTSNSKGNILSATMSNRNNNIILIGMAGAGKSTVGPLLADALGYKYIDTDKLIEAARGETLQAIVDELGLEAFKTLEEQTVLTLTRQGHVIATGGSVIYSARAMDHLKSIGVVVLLDISLPTLENRVGKQSARGLVGRKNQTFADLYTERLPLYRQYADIQVQCSHCTPEQLAEQIETALTTHLPADTSR